MLLRLYYSLNPQFVAPLQNTFYGLNPQNNADNNKGFMVIGPHIWAPIADSMPATHPFPARLRWGGSNAGNGNHFIQHVGYNPTFYANPEQTLFAEGVNVFTRTNMAANVTGSTGYNNIGSRFQSPFTAITESTYRVSRFFTDHEGKLLPSEYSLNNGSTWTNGFINWTTLEVDSTVGMLSYNYKLLTAISW